VVQDAKAVLVHVAVGAKEVDVDGSRIGPEVAVVGAILLAEIDLTKAGAELGSWLEKKIAEESETVLELEVDWGTKFAGVDTETTEGPLKIPEKILLAAR